MKRRKGRRMVKASGELSVLSTKTCVDGGRKENTVTTVPFPSFAFLFIIFLVLDSF